MLRPKKSLISKLSLGSLLVSALMLELVVPPTARAAGITPLEQERYLQETTYSTTGGLDSNTKTSAPDFGHFEVDTRHISDILPMELRGELHAYGGAWLDPFEGEVESNEYSYYRVEFAVDESIDYVLTAEIDGRDDGRYGLGTAGLWLSAFNAELGNYETLFYFYSPGDYILIPVLETGTLSPGQYQLTVNASGSGLYHSYDGGLGGSGHATFAFVVPEPTTGILMGVGLALLATRHKQRG